MATIKKLHATAEWFLRIFWNSQNYLFAEFSGYYGVRACETEKNQYFTFKFLD